MIVKGDYIKMNFIIELLVKTFLETAYLTGIIILIGFLLGVLRNSSLRNFQRSFGNKALMITGFIGVPVHELSHGIVAFLFGHKVGKIKVFQKPDLSGVMGYVRHSYNKSSIYQQIGNFFIGIAPIFGGTISIVALMRFIIPETYNKFIKILIENISITILSKASMVEITNSYLDLIKNIFSLQNFKNPYFFIFLFVAICVSSHISLSSADIKGASKGLGVIFLILFMLNLIGITKVILAGTIIKYNILITGVLAIAVILSFITYLISLIAVTILRR